MIEPSLVLASRATARAVLAAILAWPVATFGQTPDSRETVAQANPQTPSQNEQALWEPEVTRTGTHCLMGPDNLRLRRQSGDGPLTVKVFGPANSPSATDEYAAG